MSRSSRRPLLCALASAVAVSTVTLVPLEASAATYRPPAFAAKVPASTTQVVRTVRTNRWCAKVYCTKTQAWHKVNGRWKLVRLADGSVATFRSSIGPYGFAAPGTRREGDGKTPTGIYKITVTFSTTAENPGTAMPWKRRKPTSVVPNYKNRYYNTWIEQGWRTDGDRPSMRYGFWVGYNNPRLKVGVGPAPVYGKGSGIFYHTSPYGQKWTPTLACTKVGEPSQMRWIVRWLRPDANPRVSNNI